MTRIVSVAACGNGSGKTTLMETILRAFPGRFVGVKFTTVFRDGVNCPRTESACACRELHGAFSIVRDSKRLAQENTDTGRLGTAGARAVYWCLARPGAHAEAWAHMQQEILPPRACLLTEGNSIVPVLSPSLLVVLLTPRLERRRWKPDLWDLAGRADHVVVNSWGAGPDETARLADEAARRLGGRRPLVEDPARPLAGWADTALCSDLGRLLDGPAGG